MSPIGASFAFGAPPSTMPGIVPSSVVRGAGEVVERRCLAVDHGLADDVRRGQRAVTLDARVEVAAPGEEVTRPGVSVTPKSVGPPGIVVWPSEM